MNLGEAARIILEIGNFQYPWSWTDWNWSGNGYWFRAEAKSTAGPQVKVLIEGNPDEEIEVSFKRSGDGKWSMDKTGQGDEFKIFGTVANIIDAFIERYNKEEGSSRPLHKLIFSAEKEKTPSFRGTKYSKTNRASLYSKMAERLAKKYKAQFTQKEYAATTEYGFIFPEQKRKLATEAREILDKSAHLGIEEAKIVWNTDQQKLLDKQKSKRRRSEKELFSSGPLKIKWSQTRGGYAIFVKGRMEGETFDSIDDAKEYLRDLGIDK